MKYLGNVILSLLERLAVLIIAALMIFIIFSKLDSLLDTGIVKQVEENITRSEDLVVHKEGSAPIVYKGQNAQAYSQEETTEDALLVEGSKRDYNIVSFEIYEGQTPEEVSQLFVDLGLITSPPTFLAMLEDANLLDGIRPGTYDVQSNITNLDLIDTITVSPAIQEIESENPELMEAPTEEQGF